MPVTHPATGRRTARRRSALTLAALATIGLGATGQAWAAPALSVDPATGLNPAGQQVAVAGQGFTAPEVPSGFYVAQTATVDGEIHYAQDTSRWVRSTPGPPGVVLLGADGSFSTTIDAAPTVPRTGGGEPIDCRVATCAITAWPQHTTPTAANVYTSQALAFQASPALTVSPADGLDPAGQSLAVSGNHFSAPLVPSGFYVAQTAIVDGVVHFAQDNSRWVRPTPGPPGVVLLGGDGSFSTTINATPTVPRTGGGDAIDCRVATCAISAWPQHTVPSAANLYASRPIGFLPVSPQPVVPTPPSNPTPVAPVAPTPPTPADVLAPQLASARGLQALARNRTAVVGSITCRTGPCRVTAPTQVVVRIGSTRQRVAVLVSRHVRHGATAGVRVRLSSAALRALRATPSRRVVVPVRVSVRSGESTTTRVLRATVRTAAR